MALRCAHVLGTREGKCWAGAGVLLGRAGLGQVLDPSAVEESAMGGRFSVAVSSHEGDVCALQKPGGIPVSASQLLRCVRIAAAKAPELEQMLRTKVGAPRTRAARLPHHCATLRSPASRSPLDMWAAGSPCGRPC